MTLLCSEWYEGRDIDNGDTIEEAIEQSYCSFYESGSIRIFADGEYGDFSGDSETECNEHGERVRDYNQEDLYEHAASLLSENTSYFVCTNEDHNPEEYLIFIDEDHYTEHQTAEHGIDGEVDTPTTTPPPGIRHAGDPPPMDATGHRWHPDITENMRRQIDIVLVHPSRHFNGLLIPSTRAVTVTYVMGVEQPPTPDNFRFWAREWPGHFYIDINDPHLTQGTSQTHASWT